MRAKRARKWSLPMVDETMMVVLFSNSELPTPKMATNKVFRTLSSDFKIMYD